MALRVGRQLAQEGLSLGNGFLSSASYLFTLLKSFTSVLSLKLHLPASKLDSFPVADESQGQKDGVELEGR